MSYIQAAFNFRNGLLGASQVSLVVKNPPANAGDIREVGSIPGSGRSWRRAWQPTPVFLPAESHGQRSLASYGLWGCRELDMIEQLTHLLINRERAVYNV